MQYGPSQSRGFAVVDLETSAIKPEYGRIIEVGVVQLDRSASIEGTFETLINPEGGVGRSDIHGIRKRDVIGAPTFAQAADRIAQLLDGRIIVAHNSRFDLGFLHAEFRATGRPCHLPALCTCTEARHFIDTPSRSLRTCCLVTGIDLRNAHSALSDATATAQLLQHFLRVSTDGIPAGDTPLPASWDRVLSGAEGVSQIPYDTNLSAFLVPKTR